MLRHRGPDGEGVWLDDDQRVGLAHQRLAVLDLSPAGHQPMASRNGQFVVCFNGEIYNHLALRRELECDPARNAHGWRGHSDTETITEAIAQWGLRLTLERCVGMFAVAVWDRKERSLSLARDRFGEKPLYYGWTGGAFLFASELKALKVYPGFNNPLNRRAIALLLARTYIPAPHSIYEGIHKLEPGCILTVDADVWRDPLTAAPAIGDKTRHLRLERYWSYLDVVRGGLARPIATEDEAIERLDGALAEAIKGQSVADVPVGAFLSGGIDSATVVGLYRKYVTGTVRTFSIGFEESAYNETDDARAVARHFGTEHHEAFLSARETMDLVPHLGAMYDEPFADSSQIPTHLVSRFARGHVTVALSGDGGDELFGGYNRHFRGAQLWALMRRLPNPVRRRLGHALSLVPPNCWQDVIDRMSGRARSSHLGTKAQKIFRTLANAKTLEDVYESFIDEWSGSPSPVLGVQSSGGFELSALGTAPDAVKIMYADSIGFLPDDILCKVDRAAMAVGLETRLPFLDHRVAELAAAIPIEMKITGGQGKAILRKLLYREAPQTLFQRPKTGFGLPMGEWLRGPLRDWAEDLLDARRMRDEGYIDPQPVRARWEAHLSGRVDAAQSLWAVLMFETWLHDEHSSPVSIAA
jgi:asparagine synthase (glutamine-hydrolysing)